MALDFEKIVKNKIWFMAKIFIKLIQNYWLWK